MRKILVTTLFLVACGGFTPKPDAGQPDSGIADAGPADAGPRDSGVDAGFPDSGMPDGGMPDAGDAGPSDAGIDDAGVADAGHDAGAICSTGAECISGTCLPTGDCFACQADSECWGGRVCSSGVCAEPCVTSATCTAGQECCNSHCVDVAKSPSHCGQCGHACTGDEFCGVGTCHAADFSALCEMPHATVLLNGVAEDEDAGMAIGAALASSCPSLPLRALGFDGGIQGPTGHALVLGELLIAGGGSFHQPLVAWLEATNQAHVRDISTTSQAIYALRDGGIVSQVPFATLGLTKDRFVIQIVRTTSGALVLQAAGYRGPGTLAAATYYIDTVNPTRATLTSHWYVVEWDDVDASGGPTAGDTYTLIAEGA
jgi:Stigma-specific protein, Stig1